MGKRVLWFLLFGIAWLGVRAGPAEAATCFCEPAVAIHGRLLEAERPFFLDNNRIFGPVDRLAAVLGAEVGWLGEAEVRVSRGGHEVRFVAQRAAAEVDGVLVPLDGAPLFYLETLYVPLRALAEGLGESVGWHGASFTALVGRSPLEPLAVAEQAALAAEFFTDLSWIKLPPTTEAVYGHFSQWLTEPALSRVAASVLGAFALPTDFVVEAEAVGYQGLYLGPERTLLVLEVEERAPGGHLVSEAQVLVGLVVVDGQWRVEAFQAQHLVY